MLHVFLDNFLLYFFLIWSLFLLLWSPIIWRKCSREIDLGIFVGDSVSRKTNLVLDDNKPAERGQFIKKSNNRLLFQLGDISRV